MASRGDDHPSDQDVAPLEADSESDLMEADETPEKGKEEVTQGPREVVDVVERSITLLRRANTDTEKFAALLMMTKLIKADHLDEIAKGKLLDAIGLPFLARLLTTTEVPEGCPPFIFKSVALTFLSVFISSCLGNAILYGLVPTLSEIVSKSELYDDCNTIVKDTFQCLRYIATDKGGRKAIIDLKLIGVLVDAYTKESLLYENALEILLVVLNEEGSQTWENDSEAFIKLMNKVTHDFATDQEEKKFKLCEYLTEFLQTMPAQVDTSGEQPWKRDLLRGISDIVLSKLSRDQRDGGLRLTGAALEVLGVAWVLQNAGERSGDHKGRKLLLVMVHLACIEVRMSLEDKSLQEVVALASPTVSCYVILELAINFLVNGAVEFEQKQKQQLYAALKGAFNAVLIFLKEAAADDLLSENPRCHLFVCATIRVLGAWLAEETAANKEDICNILPFVMKTCRYNFEENIRTASKLKTTGYIKNHQQREESKDRLPDILRFLLPGLCHLTADDTSRVLLLECEVDTLLFEYLKYQWESIGCIMSTHSKTEGLEAPLYKIESASEAMETLGNIFMNIVVQERERIESEPLYYTLLKFIFAKLPDIPTEDKHLRLCGTLCTLGLMVLRHQHSNVKSTDFSIFRFIQTTVRFLWDAHNVEESRDYATLVVSLKYEPHWASLNDVWFLGMHTLSVLLPIIPWLCDFLIESEWPQTIILTLIRVREGGVDQGLKSAYEDFLCQLAKSSNPACWMMQEKGIDRVCQNHKLEELAQVFNQRLA